MGVDAYMRQKTSATGIVEQPATVLDANKVYIILELRADLYKGLGESLVIFRSDFAVKTVLVAS